MKAGKTYLYRTLSSGRGAATFLLIGMLLELLFRSSSALGFVVDEFWLTKKPTSLAYFEQHKLLRCALRTVYSTVPAVSDSYSHQRLTKEAILDPAFLQELFGASDLGSDEAASEIAEQNADTDTDQSPAFHFDNELFSESRSLLEKNFSSTVDQILKGDIHAARLYFGRTLHTLQDFYAHSTWVDLGNLLPCPALKPPFDEEFSPPPASPHDPVCQIIFPPFDFDISPRYLTTGYYYDSGVPKISQKLVHGGAGIDHYDPLSYTIYYHQAFPYCGAISKDIGVPGLSPNALLHSAAAQVAILATREMLRGLKRTIVTRTSDQDRAMDLMRSFLGQDTGLIMRNNNLRSDIVLTVTLEEPGREGLFPVRVPLRPLESKSVYLPQIPYLVGSYSIQVREEAGSPETKLAGYTITCTGKSFLKSVRSDRGITTDLGNARSHSDTFIGNPMPDQTQRHVQNVYTVVVATPSLQSTHSLPQLEEFLVAVMDGGRGSPVDASFVLDAGLECLRVTSHSGQSLSILGPNGKSFEIEKSYEEGDLVTRKIKSPASGPWKIWSTDNSPLQLVVRATKPRLPLGNGTFSLAALALPDFALVDFQFLEYGGRAGHDGFFNKKGTPIANRLNFGRARVRGSYQTLRFELRELSGAKTTSLDLEASLMETNQFIGAFEVPAEPFTITAIGSFSDGQEFQRTFSTVFLPGDIEIVRPSSAAVSKEKANHLRFQVINHGSAGNFLFSVEALPGVAITLSEHSYFIDQGTSFPVDVVVRTLDPTLIGQVVNIEFAATIETGKRATAGLSVFVNDPLSAPEAEPAVVSTSQDGQGRKIITFDGDLGAYFILMRQDGDGVGNPVAMAIGNGDLQELTDKGSAGATTIYSIKRVAIEQPEDNDGDGIDDYYELLHPDFLDPLVPDDAGRDFDQDGLSNLQEYRASTNPADPPQRTLFIKEGDVGVTNLTVRIRLNKVASKPITITVRTEDGSARASARDFVSTRAELILSPGEVFGRIEVPISGDTDAEGDETFKVVCAMGTLEPGVSLVTDSFECTIVDDDRPRPTYDGPDILVMGGNAISSILPTDPGQPFSPAYVVDRDSRARQWPIPAPSEEYFVQTDAKVDTGNRSNEEGSPEYYAGSSSRARPGVVQALAWVDVPSRGFWSRDCLASAAVSNWFSFKPHSPALPIGEKCSIVVRLRVGGEVAFINGLAYANLDRGILPLTEGALEYQCNQDSPVSLGFRHEIGNSKRARPRLAIPPEGVWLFITNRFTHGDILTNKLSLRTSARINFDWADATNSTRILGLASFERGVYWDGILGLFDSHGRQVDDFSVLSSSGYDWSHSFGPLQTPALRIVPSLSPGFNELHWPVRQQVCFVESTTSLAVPWSKLLEQPEVVGDEFVLTVPNSQQQRFFRLSSCPLEPATRLTLRTYTPDRPKTISCEPAAMIFTSLASTQSVQVLARYADGSVTNVSGATSWTRYSIVGDSGVATVDRNGLVTPIGDGQTWLRVCNENVWKILPVTVFAGRNSARVVGRVIDVDELPAKGCLVRIVETGQTASTDDNGAFAFEDVPRGPSPIVKVLASLPRSDGTRKYGASDSKVLKAVETTDVGLIILNGARGLQRARIPADGIITGTPTPNDLDGDGLPNLWEVAFGYDPIQAKSVQPDKLDGDLDPDDDGVGNREEALVGTDAFNYDSDGDLWDDRTEIDQASDPLDPTSVPSLFSLSSPPVSVLLPGVGEIPGLGSDFTVGENPATVLLSGEGEPPPSSNQFISGRVSVIILQAKP